MPKTQTMMQLGEEYKLTVRKALRLLNKRNLSLIIHGCSFPALDEQDTGCGTFVSQGARHLVDFTKDILYVEKADSKVRRSVQTVLYNVLSREARILAPILPYTSEEVYKLLEPNKESVHLEDMPEVVRYNDEHEVLDLFNLFFELKEKVYKELENARNEKVIGSGLEAEVKINLDNKYKVVKEKLGDCLEQLLIVSKITYVDSGAEVEVVKHSGEKCDRCWKYVDHLHEGLCDRCQKAILQND